MSNIKNVPDKADDKVEAVRSAIEFRATWFALLFDEMRKAGADAEGITRRAIRRCGREIHGPRAAATVDGRPLDGEDIEKFSFNELMRKVFIMNPVTADKDNADAYLLLPACGGMAEDGHVGRGYRPALRHGDGRRPRCCRRQRL